MAKCEAVAPDGGRCVFLTGHYGPHLTHAQLSQFASIYPPITRTYPGNPYEANAVFQQDAATLASQGYFPTSQIYTEGQYGCGAFVVAALLFIVLIGFLVLIYLLMVKPPGSLLVTYEYRPPQLAA
jgi:hypothetical protein